MTGQVTKAMAVSGPGALLPGPPPHRGACVETEGQLRAQLWSPASAGTLAGARLLRTGRTPSLDTRSVSSRSALSGPAAGNTLIQALLCWPDSQAQVRGVGSRSCQGLTTAEGGHTPGMTAPRKAMPESPT